MMKKYIIIIGLLINSACLNSQWVSNYGGNNQGDNNLTNAVGITVTSDNAGNSYVAGYILNQITGYDIILIKYNKKGAAVFTKTYNGNSNGNDRAFGIAVDEDGNIYIIGQTEITGRALELILLKYSSSGNLMWTRTYGDTKSMKDDIGYAIVLDEANNIYVTGFVTKSDNHKDIVIIKFNSSGKIVWLKTEDGVGNLDSEGSGIAADENGSVYITGYTTSANNSSKTDIITQKYASNGSLNWTAIYNNNEEDKAFGISVDDADNVYITGYTTIETNPLNTSAVLVKYNINGIQSWVKTEESGINGSLDKAFGIITDGDIIYITGQKASQNQGLNYFTSKYDQSGSKLWSTTYDGPGHGNDYTNAITVLKNHKVAVTGASWGINNDFDYATVVMNKSGNTLDVYRYTLSRKSNDIAKDISSSNDNIYVTGYSESIQHSQEDGVSAISTLQYLGGNSDDILLTNTPAKFSLYQNYPNPFNPSTNIKFDISNRSYVKLVVYDLLGKVVDVMVDQELEAGSYNLTYKNSSLSSGVYFYKLTAGNFTDVKKMSLIK